MHEIDTEKQAGCEARLLNEMKRDVSVIYEAYETLLILLYTSDRAHSPLNAKSLLILKLQ